MLQRHHFKAVAVEGIVGKLGYCLVHTSLAGEHVDIARVVTVSGLELRQQAFEERPSAICKIDVAQQGFVNSRFLLRLLYNGRQLLVVAYQYKAFYGISASRLGAEQTNQVWLQNL